MSDGTQSTQYLQSLRDDLLQKKIDNFNRMSELEEQIYKAQGELAALGRTDQGISLQLAQIKQRLNIEENSRFEQRFINECKQVLDKEAYLKIVAAAKDGP